MEDFKGLEVVLLLGAITLREVFNGHLKDVFNIVDLPIGDDNGSDSRKTSNALPAPVPRNDAAPHSDVSLSQPSLTPAPKLPRRLEPPNPRLPPTDPRSQWEIDLETERLKKQVEREYRERRRLEHAETKRVKKMLEAEERAARAKKAEIDKETERLKKLYAVEQQPVQDTTRPQLPSHHNRPPQSSAHVARPLSPRPHSAAAGSIAQSSMSRGTLGSHIQRPINPSWNGFSGGSYSAQNEANRIKPKRSLFGMRSVSDEHPRRLAKKQSVLW